MICSFTILWLFFDLATLSLAGATPWSASVPQSCWSRCCVSAPCTVLPLLVLCVPCPWSSFWLTGVTKGRPQHRAMSKVQLRNKSWPRCARTQYARRVPSQGLCAPQARTSHGARSSPLSVNLGQEQGFSRTTTSNQHFYFSNRQLVESETVGCPLSSEQLWEKSSNAVQLTWDQQIWEDYCVILSAGYNLRTSSTHEHTQIWCAHLDAQK